MSTCGPFCHTKNYARVKHVVQGRRKEGIDLTEYGIYYKYGECRSCGEIDFPKPPASVPRPTNMLRSKLISVHPKSPLGYLVNTRKALRILLTHKIRDTRFQQLLARWVCTLLPIISFGICGFFLVPTFWAVSVFAPAMFLFALFLSVGAGDLFLKFALEDERFFDVATKNHALSVFEDNDQSLPQPPR